MVRKEETTVKRRLTAVCLALLISLSFSGCSDGRTEKNSSSDESKLTALPTFSSESELAEFLNEQNIQTMMSLYIPSQTRIFLQDRLMFRMGIHWKRSRCLRVINQSVTILFLHIPIYRRSFWSTGSLLHILNWVNRELRLSMSFCNVRMNTV